MLPGPSLAEDLKTVCGNPSRPPGLGASRLRVLQAENTETERLASSERVARVHSQAAPTPWPPARPSLLLQGWGCKPLPACSQMLRAGKLQTHMLNAREGCQSRKGALGT